MIKDIEVTDLVKIRMKDFKNFLKIFKFTGSNMDKLQAELNFQDVLELYSQNLIPTEFLVKLLKNIEDDGIEQLLRQEQLIINQYNKTGIVIAPGEIHKYKDAIQKGIVSDIWVSLPHLQLYQEYIPTICYKALEKLNSKFAPT